MAQVITLDNFDELIDEAIQFHYDVLEYAATTASEILTETAAEAIDSFYDSYKPKRYVRMFRNFGYSGGRSSKRSYEGRTYRPYVHISPQKTIFSGGVELSWDKMFDDYTDSVENVFWDVYRGFHGPAEYVTPMKESPLIQIMRARDALEKQSDFCIRQAVRYVKEHNNYKYLNIR